MIHDPPMLFNDDGKKIWEEGLAKNDDPYGHAVYEFASMWATKMEQAVATGAKLEDVAKDLGHEAAEEAPGGLTGFMYGCAMSLLSQVWVHGEDLRRWHNLDTQIKDEGERANESGGVLNPAILTIGSKD